MNLVEIVAVVFSLLSVIFAVKNNVLTWPIGIIGILSYSYIFYDKAIWGNMFLQLLFIIQSIYGWYNWDKNKNSKIQKLEKCDRDLFILVTGILCFFLVFILVMTDDKSPYLDGITTGLSLIATLLLIFKKIDNWYYWIITNIIYIYLFYNQELYWSTIIYFIFLLLSISGLKTWKKNIKMV